MERFLILIALLPYFKTSPMGTDVQPYFLVALVVYLAIFVSQKRRAPVHGYSVLAGFYLGSTYLVLGGGAQSIILFLFPVSIDLFSRQTRENIIWALNAAMVVLFFGILLQVINDPLVDELVSNHRASAQRGFTSFTSEPSYLGILGFFICITLLVLKAGSRWVILAIVLVVLSASATALIPLVVVLGFYFLKGWRVLLLPIGISLVIFLAIAIAKTDTRLGGLLKIALESPEALLIDVSISNRITRAFGPIYEAATDYFIPHRSFDELEIGFSFIADSADASVSRLSNIASVMAYSFGFLAVPVIWFYFQLSLAPVFYWVSIFFIVLLNLSVATPYLLIVLAIPIWLKRYEYTMTLDKVRIGPGLNVQKQ